MSNMKIKVHDMELYRAVPVNEMAYRKPQMEAKLISQTRNIVEWWGFLYYMAHYADVKYYQAVKVADSTQFNYAFTTNEGHTLAYGTVTAVGYVTGDGIGNYMTITRVLEEYRQHTRKVCTGEGKDRSCHTEEYWTWDDIGRKRFAVNQVNFLGRNFYYGAFPELPGENYITTINLPSRGFFQASSDTSITDAACPTRARCMPTLTTIA